MLGKALGFPSQQPLITVSHLLLARTEPFPKTVVMLSPGKCRALLALNTRVSAALWLCPVPASLTEKRNPEVVWGNRRQQVLPGFDDKTRTWAIQALLRV